LEEARQMTGTMHVADHQGDTTHTWDTADPRTVREIEEIFREAQATGRLVSECVACCPSRSAPSSRAHTDGTDARA
jgi:hypothetical protein